MLSRDFLLSTEYKTMKRSAFLYDNLDDKIDNSNELFAVSHISYVLMFSYSS